MHIKRILLLKYHYYHAAKALKNNFKYYIETDDNENLRATPVLNAIISAAFLACKRKVQPFLLQV